MEKIEKAFLELLELGINANGSLTPAPLVTLSIFARNIKIIEAAIAHGANPNANFDIVVSTTYISFKH